MQLLGRELTKPELEIVHSIDRKLSPKEMKEMHRLAEELEVPLMCADVFFEQREPGHDFRVVHAQEMNSWTRNAYTLLLANLGGDNVDDSSFGAGFQSCKDTGGTIRYSANRAMGLIGCSPNHGDLTEGIVVGTGTTAESFEDYVLDTMIAHGTGAGQLIAYAQSYTIADWDGAGRTFDLNMYRHFHNDSGGSITVNEVGIIGYCQGASLYDIMIARDKLSSGVAVADGNTLRVLYSWTTGALPSS